MSLSASSGMFVGREAELDDIARLLSDPACRLLTLVGLGGIGKTRLALEAIRQLTDSRFVPLQPLTSPDFIVAAIADALGFQFYSGSDPKQQLLDYLREKSLLLVLDNFEHLLDGATLLSEILASAPTIRLLVTSRERLNLTEEWALDVGGLAYPSDENESQPEQYGAVALFVQHARRAKVSFALMDDNRSAVARICRLVGGMPLALELAASWVRALSCAAIADEIVRSLDILETPARNVEPRHRTMRAAFEPTWERLTDHEREVFMKLSVFRGGFTREAAKEVAGASLRTLSALVDKALVRVDAAGRYDVHELLRQFAAEKLVDADALESATERHIDYFVTFAEQVEAHEYGRDQQVWYDYADADFDNLRAALAYSAQTEQIEAGLRLAAALSWFWENRAHWFEGLEWLERLLASDDTILAPLRAKALHAAGEISTGIGKQRAAESYLNEALSIARATNDEWNIAWALAGLGRKMMNEGVTSGITPVMHESLALSRKLNNSLGVSHVLRRLAMAEETPNEDAIILLNEALQNAREAGAMNATAWSLALLGIHYWFGYHEYKRAVTHVEESIVLFRQLRNMIGCTQWSAELGVIEHLNGNDARALNLFREALALLREYGNYGRNELALCSLYIAYSALDQGRLEHSTRLLAATVIHRKNIKPLFFGGFDNAAAVLRERLGEAAFAAAWAEGKSMTGEQTADYALETVKELSDETVQAHIQAAQSLTESLTAGELKVLRLMANDLTNGEIAERLVLAQSTIKWYVRRIFSKLDTTSRTQAVARGRALGLLR